MPCTRTGKLSWRDEAPTKKIQDQLLDDGDLHLDDGSASVANSTRSKSKRQYGKHEVDDTSFDGDNGKGRVATNSEGRRRSKDCGIDELLLRIETLEQVCLNATATFPLDP